MNKKNRIIRLGEVLARTSLSRSTIYRKIKEGTFPAQKKLSKRSVGWFESAINTWMEGLC